MLKAKIVNVTPEIAKEMLVKNTENYRQINHRKVETYSREMALGLWQENGEPIHVYEDGTLANGQHRLTAVVKSGATFPMLIVTGIKKTVNTFDRGGNRSIAQILRANGVNIDSQESSALAILKLGFYGVYGADEIIEYASRLKDYDVVFYAIRKGAHNPILKKAGVLAGAYCAYKLNKITLNELEQFATVCNTGLPVDGINSYPPLCLRKTLQNGFRNEKGEYINGGEGVRVRTFETAYQAFCDFHNGNNRVRNYVPKGNATEILTAARKVYE